MIFLSVNTTVIGISIAVFLIIILLLVAILLYAKAKLLPSGEVKVVINDDKELTVSPGST
jgi:Na+-transporting NADH:ubiquinone oxidoreductase subunit F